MDARDLIGGKKMNRITLVGNITDDIELKKTSTNKSYCNFTIAVNERIGNEKITEFIDCKAWENCADNITKYFIKGDKILIDGKLKSSTYEGNDGKKIKKWYVNVNTFEFMSNKDVRTNNESGSEYARESTSYANNVRTNGLETNTDDLPFY